MNTILAAEQSTNIAPLLLSVIVLGILFFLMIVRPQKKNVQRQKELINSLSIGDEIITSSGIYGSIVKINEDTILLNIADGVDITIALRAVSMRKLKESQIEQDSNNKVQDKEQQG